MSVPAEESTSRGAEPVVDLAVWEAGLAARYVAERVDLLPADERDLLTRLLDEPRRLWEVTTVAEGTGMDLTDTRTGDTVSVDEQVGSIGRQPGDLLLARVGRLQGCNHILGSVINVPLDARDSLTALLDEESDAGALAAWYGSLVTAASSPRAANGGAGD